MQTTIVLVDDEPDKRYLLERLFRKVFPENPIASFADCSEAIPVVLAPIPKIVVTNGKVACKDGLEFAAFVHNEANAPVVIISLRAEMEEKALAAGAIAFVETGDNPSIQKAITHALQQVASSPNDLTSGTPS